MKKKSPDALVGGIFALIGGVFLALGLVFAEQRSHMLPRLFDAATWLADEPPEELVLPMVGLVFAGLGAVFMIVGFILLMIKRREERIREELRAWGTRVTGTVEDIREDRSVSVNGRSPYRVYVRVEHPVTRQTVTVRSSRVWVTFLRPGDAVDVLFDPLHEKRYAVEFPQE